MSKKTKVGCSMVFSIFALALTACGGGSSSSNTPSASSNSIPDTSNTNSLNHAPVISGAPRSEVTVGGSYSFTPTASDSDGDSLTFTITNKPSWASFNTGNGTLSGTPSSSDMGTTSNIVITVSDGAETAQLSSFNIAVSTGSAALKWTAPTSRSDNTALPLSEIGGYRVYHGSSVSDMEVVATIDDNSVTEYSLSSLTAGSHYFAVTTYDLYGSESEFSNIGMKAIN